MTATAQLQKPAEKTSNWTQIFPAETTTQQQSALYVKKLLAVAVSNITYLRAIFPEAAFGDRCLEDLSLKILRDESTCPGACQVIKWVKGCFDALDKKYLKMMIIGIYTDPDDPDTVIESYTFKFSYTDNEGMEIYRNNKKISSSHSDAETKKATIRLLRTIVVLTQSLQSLPNDVMMTMKLFYYDDVTPEDYEPPGFKAASANSFNFDEEPMNIKVGDVSTNFHTMKLRIKTDPKQFEVGGEKPVEQENESQGVQETDAPATQQLSEDELDDDALQMCNQEMQQEAEAESKKLVDDQEVPSLAHTKGPVEGDVPMEQEAEKPDENAVDTTGSQLAQQSQDDNGVKCACGYDEDDGLMIMCAVCRCWQHGVCYQIVQEEEAPATHICHNCANSDGKEPEATDPTLLGLTEVALQATCLWRRALLSSTKLKRVLPQNMCKQLGVEMTVAQGLVNRMEKEGFIVAPAKNKRFGKLVQKEKLMEGLTKYLKRSKAFKDEKEKEHEDEPPKKSEIDTEIDAIMQKTEALDVSGKKALLNKQENPRKAKKRVKALVDGNEYEFDECDSQDVEVESSQSGKKRRKKASIASRSLRV